MHEAAQDQVLDPVCGMVIDRADATETRRFAEETYFFCSTSCATKFDADPEAYAAAPRAAGFERRYGEAGIRARCSCAWKPLRDQDELKAAQTVFVARVTNKLGWGMTMFAADAHATEAVATQPHFTELPQQTRALGVARRFACPEPFHPDFPFRVSVPQGAGDA